MAEDAHREAEVRAVVNAFGRAFVEADVLILDSFLTDNYVHVNGGSGNVLDRDDWLEWVKLRRAEIQRGELVVSDYKIGDVRITVDGDTAIVTGTVFSSVNKNGNSSTSRIRFSNIWLYQKGVWRRAAFHDSPLPQPTSNGPD